MKPRPVFTALLVASACVSAPVVPDDLPPKLLSGNACTIDVLPLPPTVPYQTLSRVETNTSKGSLELLAAEGCRLGADAIVVPVSPWTLRPAGPCVAGTFIKRLPKPASLPPTPPERS